MSRRAATHPNTASTPPLTGHLALLQQLALTANAPNGAPTQPAIQLRNTQPSSAPQHPHPSHLNSEPQPYSSSHTQHNPGRDSWQSRSNQFDHGRERDGFHDSNSRGGFQRGFRGRGWGRGRWDDRDHDRFKDRDWNSSPRPRNSRSRSPRRFNVQRPRPYSPPQRPAANRDVAPNQNAAKLSEAGKDEFGRDIRPSSATPPRAASVDAQTQPPMVPSVNLARTAAPENRVPVSDQLPSVAASTSTQKVETRKPSSAPALQQPGLDQFDITTFDFTAPSSWEALGKMWHSTYGDTPTQEELMQFIMTGGVVAFPGQANAVQAGQWQEPSWSAQSAGHGRGWQGVRGRGRGLVARTHGTLGHGNHRDGGHWGEDAQHADAIVLGEAGGQDGGHGEEQAYTDLAQIGKEDLPNADPDDPQNDFNAMNAENGSAEKWLTTFTKALRAKLPQGMFTSSIMSDGDVLTTRCRSIHFNARTCCSMVISPIAFMRPAAELNIPVYRFSSTYSSGAYLTVNKNIGSLIDWYNFYNQGTTEYTTCSGLLTKLSSTWPKTSVFQIAAAGVSLDKLVICKPATTADASNGYMSTTLLAQCVDQAYKQGWDAGVMVHNATSAYSPTSLPSSSRPSTSWGGEDLLSRLRSYAHLLRSTLQPSLFIVDPSKADIDTHTTRIFDDDAVDDILAQSSYASSHSPIPAHRRPCPLSSVPANPPNPYSTHSSALHRSLYPPSISTTQTSSQARMALLSNITRATRHAAQNILPHPLAKLIVPHLPDPVRSLVNVNGDLEWSVGWRKGALVKGDRARKREAQALPSSSSNVVEEISPLGVFELLHSTINLPSPKRSRDPAHPIDEALWAKWFDNDGRPKVRLEEMRRQVFRRGITPHGSLRKKMWPFILGVQEWDITESEREMKWEEKRKRYNEIKDEWCGVPKVFVRPDVLEERYRIDVDCRRTDRTQPLFSSAYEDTADNGLNGNRRYTTISPQMSDIGAQSPSNEHIGRLAGILPTYNFYNKELGYVQGMSDLCAPLYVVMGSDEELTFWCFAEVMNCMIQNLLRDQSGMKKQLSTLQELISVMDPDLYRHLEKTDGLNLFFCFRWVLITFKREFSFDDVLCLWGVLWTNYYSNEFVLFVALAVLESHRDMILRYLFDEILILKYCNELSMTIELDSTLAQAEVLFLSFAQLVADFDRRRADEATDSTSSVLRRRGTSASEDKASLSNVSGAAGTCRACCNCYFGDAKAKTAMLSERPSVLDLPYLINVPNSRQTQLDVLTDHIERSKRIFVKQNLEINLVSLQFEALQYELALSRIDTLLTELKKLDGKMILTEVHLLESRVYPGTGNLSKAKVGPSGAILVHSFLTSVEWIGCPRFSQDC
ncbi:uncharacterized protein F5147DRAFT_822544 [Suillus discolor]|uniref:Rab-GAP TBC domain-containing protein n=1 Tax=Suillus discolor TaxID=1912936 RepID=A0A9P7EW16_9AGAM|nr:uncharacterized protein F5147DRAFT_822544 [Suillus discolor]KAG2092308.1 hypothetical protein F5147DRAFT_822544 [Suillus discolor]